MSDASDAFGASLKRLRQERGWSQRVLAAQAGVSTAAISTAERGITGPSLTVAAALARALGAGLDAMTGLSAPACGHCRDAPPAGFTCQACGAGQETAL